MRVNKTKIYVCLLLIFEAKDTGYINLALNENIKTDKCFKCIRKMKVIKVRPES